MHDDIASLKKTIEEKNVYIFEQHKNDLKAVADLALNYTTHQESLLNENKQL